jgi:membrane-associated phospholipid phosphatase
MDDTTNLPGKQSLDGTIANGDSKRQDARATRTRWIVAITFWIIGFMALIVASVIVHSHPSPWPFEVQTTITMQQLQLQLPFWVSSPIVWASIVDNPIPSAIGFVLWFVILSLIGVVVWRRGGSPIPWFVTAVFISIGIPVMAGLNAIIGHLVARPRPTSPPIHVFMPENGIPSFPSGHVENDVVYFGFLLYLSFTKPVSQWRYRWVLIPFQLYAALNILFIGYSRVLEGSHWLNDALAGYLTGALLLALLVVLYRWTLDKLNKWYAKRLLEKSAQNQQT